MRQDPSKRAAGPITALLLVAVIWALAVERASSGSLMDTEHEWIARMTQAVLMAQVTEGEGGMAKYLPYLKALQIVLGALERGEDQTVYATMNRFMEMLEVREHGIAPELADWLLDYCDLVTPAKYHDVSRHIRKVAEWQRGRVIVLLSLRSEFSLPISSIFVAF